MEIVDWIYLTQDRENLWTVVSTVMKLRIPRNMDNFFSG